MCKLSVNINKIATLRNSRGGNVPDVIRAAIAIQGFGAQGITVHPRPDERHITYRDVRELKKIMVTEFNIEGNPKEKKFVDLVLETLPDQVTLVPDSGSQLTSDHGWDTFAHAEFLKEMIATFKARGIRTSIFVDPDEKMIEGALETGAERVELYTEAYAAGYEKDKFSAIAPFIRASQKAQALGIGLNAGHDLNLNNLAFFKQHIPGLLEVSIGHALISDALYFGLENTVQLYLRQLK